MNSRFFWKERNCVQTVGGDSRQTVEAGEEGDSDCGGFYFDHTTAAEQLCHRKHEMGTAEEGGMIFQDFFGAASADIRVLVDRKLSLCTPSPVCKNR